MSKRLELGRSLVDSVDDLIKLVDEWPMLQLSLPSYSSTNTSNASNASNASTARRMSKKRSHASAMPDEPAFDQIPAAKKSRLLRGTDKDVNCLKDLMQEAKQLFAQVMSDCIGSAYSVNFSDKEVNDLILGQMSRPRHNMGDISVPCFRFSKKLGANPKQIATTLTEAINKYINENEGMLVLSNPFVKVEAAQGYINVHLKPEYLGSIIDLILNESNSFLDTLPWDEERCKGIKRVMVEYSQPNTHKAFHVGHMRNVALGDCLVRLYEHAGFEVVAANYFGDEGAHVAKCLWLLQGMIESGVNLDDTAPAEGKGEWLGGYYTDAVRKLSIKTYTDLPYPGVVAARVLSKEKHPNAEAPPNWHVVQVEYGQDAPATVVCGGEGYEVGDFVPYVPLGGKFNGKDVVPRDMKGVSSNGVIMSALELGVKLPPPSQAAEDKSSASKPEASDAAAAADAGGQDQQQQQQKKGKKDKKKKKQKQKQKKEPKKVDKRILLLTKYLEASKLKPGQTLVDIGRFPDTDIDAKEDIEAVVSKRDQEQRKILHKLEHGDEAMVSLWHKTRQWCLDDFHKIYDWLGARFDHDFCESECSEPSRNLVDEFFAKGVFVKDSGAIGINLGPKLGFCMLLKSDGTGLYATKDLALAKIKFDTYKIDKSIYVVDSAQSHHFEQVFATLEAMGYERAKNCYHLAYAFVTLPSGRMASRQGRVVLFSQLRGMLQDEIERKVFKSKDASGAAAAESDVKMDGANGANGGDAAVDDDVVTTGNGKAKKWVNQKKSAIEWSDEERAEAVRLISVATIRYGMLNHDPNKEIVFDLEEWSDTSGDTGPYLMYQYTRVASIGRNVARPDGVEANYALLVREDERGLVYQLSEFQNRVKMACEMNNPSALCSYLFDIAQAFSSWYTKKENNIQKCEDPVLKVTRLNFAEAVASTLRKGLGLLGIQVLERM